MKKAVSVGTSAALLASLFAAVIAAPVSAAVTVTSAGSVPQGGTSSGTVTFLFTETSATALGTVGTEPGSLTVTINGPTAAQVSFSGTPTVSAPGSLGATATAAGNVLTVSWTGNDPSNVETIQIGGLKISAIATATPGPITAALTGTGAAAFFAAPTTVSVSGKLAADLAAGGATVGVTLASACPFTTTGGVASQAQFSDASDPRNVTAGAVAAGVQSITFAPGTLAHPAGTTVTQTAAYAGCTVLPGAVGIIGSAAVYSANSTPTVFPGEANSPAGSLNLDETANVVQPFFSADGTTVTLKIDNAGVLFSTRPTFSVNLGAPQASTLSTDHTTATFTVTGTVAVDTVDIANILYDVPGSIAGGTSITVTASLSGGLLVNPTSVANAIVGRGVTATATPVPVKIGQNQQKTGLVTLTELQAGFFSAGPGPTNVFAICLNRAQDDAVFTSPGPWAKVTTTGTGALVLREGTTASPDNIVQGTPFTISLTEDECYYWTVWTASTVASTIQIGNADFTSGPLVDVLPNAVPGALDADILVGSAVNVGSLADSFRAATVQIATKVFANQVAVTAVTQPTIPKGSLDSLAGNIQIQETAPGQLKNNEQICVVILPRVTTQISWDTWLPALNTALLPVAEASGGAVVSAVNFVNDDTNPCITKFQDGISAGQLANAPFVEAFTFTVLQQSTNGQGGVLIKNIHYATAADAVNGPVQVSVFGLGGLPTSVEFQSTISNAKIGTAGVADAWIAMGLNARAASAFSLGTAAVKRGTYVTVRAKSSNAPSGTLGQIWVKTKTTAWHLESSRRVGTDGYLYYSAKVLNLGYRYYKVTFNAGGTSNTVRAFGK